MLYPSLFSSIKELDISQIQPTRQSHLEEHSKAISNWLNSSNTLNLQFICTHNSRRSHFAQIWAQALAYHFGFQNLQCYSGGTEVTKLNENVIETIEKQGFEVTKLSGGENSIYAIKMGENLPAIVGFSKKYDHRFNPQKDFVAVMTCNHADQNCPIVSGAKERLSLPFDDPKRYDETDHKAQKYAECSIQIATELYFLFSKIKLNHA